MILIVGKISLKILFNVKKETKIAGKISCLLYPVV